jgi:proteasome accessory factor C
MLGIVSYLETNGDTSFANLAAQFGVDEQQIKRDVATLWVSGLPGYMPDDLIDFDADLFEQGVARLTAGQGVSQVRLSAREAVALMGALASFIASGAAPAAVHSAFGKLQDSLGGTALATVGVSRVKQHVVDVLHSAIASGVTATLEYVDVLDRHTNRTVEPHRVVSIADVAYLECYCHRAQGYRTLRIDRIQAAALGTQPVEQPPSDSVGFTLEPVFEARVVAARGARWALEDLPGVSIVAVGDDVEASFGVADAEFVAGRLITVAPYLRSVEPRELREALAARAQAVLAAQA